LLGGLRAPRKPKKKEREIGAGFPTKDAVKRKVTCEDTRVFREQVNCSHETSYYRRKGNSMPSSLILSFS
jgi:hypothetical protein